MHALMVVAGVLLASGVAYAGGGTPWGYAGAAGPAHWGELRPEFTACSVGKNQSPINLTGFIASDLPPLGMHYQIGGKAIHNNGHTVQVTYAPGSTMVVDGHVFALTQYHFHAPSEHHINGTASPMEAHLVHADKDGNLAVIAVMFVEGPANASLAQAWTHMPEKAGDTHRFAFQHRGGGHAACEPSVLPV